MPEAPKTPPKFVPTLTEVVQMPAVHSALDQTPESLSDSTELTLRLLQRVDVLLERRIRAAVSSAVAVHTAALIGELRPIIEQAVQEAVGDALAQEATGQAPQW